MVQLKNKLIIKQEVEIAEIFTGFETGNKYSILDEQGVELLYAYEGGSSFSSKNILGAHRNLDIHVIDKNKKEIILINRPFYFLKSSATIKLSNGQVLGQIKQTKWLGTKKFDFLTEKGELLFTCISKIPKIWTFNIFMNEKKVAQIIKKWSGLGKESFTDADTFNIDFGSITDNSIKYAVLATALIIDLRLFEKKS